MRHLLLLAVLATGGGCAIDKAVGGAFYVKKELAANCASICDTLEMRLGAVVVVSNHAGCVCEPRAAADAASSGGTAIAGGAVIQIEAQQRQQQQHRTPPAPAGVPSR